MSRLPLIPAMLAIAAAVYLPFLGSRLIRTGGDEKVYVSQAIEMHSQGHWAAQTLMGEPSYFKGPVHYWLLILGLDIFGLSAWAALYMNFLFVVAGAVAMACLVRRRLPNWKGGDLWVGAFFAYNLGIYSHSLASQLEVELTSVFAIGFLLLDGLSAEAAGWAFWLVAGFAGWLKSPLHSVFMGTSAVLYWGVRGELPKRLKNPWAWAAVLAGIAFCALGYLPAYLVDRQNFINLYLIKETLAKSTSGQGWPVAIVSTFGFYLFPWVLLAVVSYAQWLFRGRELWRETAVRRLLLLSLCWVAPSVAFFLWHPYRFENYNLPVISGAILLVALPWAQRTARWQRYYSAAFCVTAAVVLFLPLVLTCVAVHFAPLPDWWPHWLLPLAWASGLYAAWTLVRYGAIERGLRPERLALGIICLFWLTGSAMAVFGEREMRDLRVFLKQQDLQGEHVSLGYYNLHKNIWSEWGILSLWIHRPVESLHTEKALADALHAGEVILIPSGEFGDQFKAFVAKNAPDVSYELLPWKRWRTRGQGEGGRSLWAEAWHRRDLSVLERDFYIASPVGGRSGS